MARKPLILILSASAGAGHMIAAHAAADEFRRRAPEHDVEVLDVLAISNPFFRKLYAGGYLGLVRHLPAAMGILYDALDQPDKRWRDVLRLSIQNMNKLPTTRLIRQRRPQLIVNTHFLPAEIVAQMRRAGERVGPQVTITTDFETHRMWVQEPTERYYTATALGRAYLSTWGVPADRILVTGIPVRSGFSAPLERGEARRRCGVEVAAGEGAALPLVLQLAGGFGVGPTEELLRELIAMPAPAEIAVIAGRNERLQIRLERLARAAARKVHVIGFTDRMHEWMSAADLVVTKPGGLTASEALCCGLPMVIVNPIPGQESRNSDYLLECGAAVKVNNPRTLGYRVGELLGESTTSPGAPRLNRLRAAAAAVARPDATARIVDDALRLIGGEDALRLIGG